MSWQEYLNSETDYLVALLRDLISFRTEAPPGSNYHAIVDYLIKVLKELGFKTEKIQMPPEIFESHCDDPRLVGDRVNLRATLDVGAKETVVIYTHLDVVPPGDGWSSDPFKVEIRDGRAYGRGVSDSKGAVAGMIAGIRAVLKNGRPKYNLSIILTTDEEVAAYSGLCYLVDQGLVKGERMLCMDGFNDDVVIGSNGVINWEVRVFGRSAHSGASFLGINAIEKSLSVMESMMAYKGMVDSKRSTLEGSSALLSEGRTHLQPVFNITMINAGVKENIVPGICVIKGDRRVIPEERMEDAMQEIEDLMSRFKQGTALRLMPGYPPMRMNPEHPWVQEVMDAVMKVTGKRPHLSGTQGSLDQSYASDVTGIPTAVYGVGRQLESNIHGVDENIRISDLEDYARFVAALICSP